MRWPQNRRVIGTKVSRLDGPEKATGRAKYSYDINTVYGQPVLHARMLRCPHAHARIRTIDTTAVERMAGVRAVHVIVKPNAELDFPGQEIAAVAADTEEHAEDAIRAIRVEYEVLPHIVKEADALRAQARTLSPARGGGDSNVRAGGESETANFAQVAYQNVDAQHEGRYGIALISHQCLESHGLVAGWNKDLTELTVYASTQAVPGTAGALAQYFKMPATRVRCITHYMGGGFGSKFGPDIQGMVAAELARKARAPVKLMLDRAEEVTVGGQRPSAYGTIKLAGNKDGTLKTFEVECYGSPGVGGGATVNFQFLPYVYNQLNLPGQPIRVNIKKVHQITQLNYQTGRAMRAPGHPQSCFLTDQPIDDLAARLNIDPLQFRLRNLPINEPNAIKTDPISYPAVRETIYRREIEIARKLSDWDRKWHPPGHDKGVVKNGIGMALHTWGGGGRPPNEFRVTIHSDGSVLAQCSTQDLGTAQRTVVAICVAEALGLEPRDITVQIGESQFGQSTGSGGSTTCPGTSPAAYKAAMAARKALFEAIAPRINAQAMDLAIEPGRIVNRENNEGMPWRQACARLGTQTATGTGDWSPGMSNNGVGGVQIAEVSVDSETGVVKCKKVVAVQDCGMIINKLGCESQVAGGVIMGVNYALFEECILDRQTGRQVNPDMEFYKLGGIQDMPQIVVHMMDMPERGVIGIGEPPTISTAAAVGNGIFNALGVRVPEAPFTPERVLNALEQARQRPRG